MEREPPVDTREAFKSIWKIWKIGGIFPFVRFKSAFVFYSIFINVTVTILFPATVIIATFVDNDLRVALTIVPYSLCLLAFMIKQFTVMIYKDNFYVIRKILKKLDQRATHEDERVCLTDVVKFCRQLFRVYVIVFYFAISITSITPLFSARRFPLPGWFPFDVTVERNYRIAYAYQVYAAISITAQTIALDIFPPLYIYVLCAHIEALAMRISRIGAEGIKDAAVIDNYKELNNCIEDHRTILQLFEEIKLLISRTLSVQFLVTAVILGSFMLNILLFEMDLIGTFSLLLLLLAVIFQVLPVCYCGNRLQDFNATLTGAIFNCNWIDEDKRFRKSVIIFMQGTQMDLEILAWNTVPITLPTFLRILKFSFSMFAVFSQLNK